MNALAHPSLNPAAPPGSQTAGRVGPGLPPPKLGLTLLFTSCARSLAWFRKNAADRTRTGCGRAISGVLRIDTINPAQFFSIIVIGFKAALPLHNARNHRAETYPHSNNPFPQPLCFRSQVSTEGFPDEGKVTARDAKPTARGGNVSS